jgi:hypothetical protein
LFEQVAAQRAFSMAQSKAKVTKDDIKASQSCAFRSVCLPFALLAAPLGLCSLGVHVLTCVRACVTRHL